MHTLELIRWWSTFWFYYSTRSFGVWIYQHGTSWLHNICPLFFSKTLRICQIARASPVHKPLQITPQIFKRFGSGLWLGLSFVNLDVCFRLSCWKMKFLFIFRFLAEAWRFYASIDWYLELFIIPSTLTKSPVPAEEKQPRSMMLPPPCFTVGMVFLW